MTYHHVVEERGLHKGLADKPVFLHALLELPLDVLQSCSELFVCVQCRFQTFSAAAMRFRLLSIAGRILKSVENTSNHIDYSDYSDYNMIPT